MVDARLADGSRVNAVIPPLAPRRTCALDQKVPDRSSSGAQDLVTRENADAADVELPASRP